jgi:hypothetical protein
MYIVFFLLHTIRYLSVGYRLQINRQEINLQTDKANVKEKIKCTDHIFHHWLFSAWAIHYSYKPSGGCRIMNK